MGSKWILFLIIVFITGCDNIISSDNDEEITVNKNSKFIRFYGSDTTQAVSDTIFLGSLNDGETAYSEFIIENKSEEELKITTIRSGCGCTTIACKGEVISPGKMVEAVVRFNTSGQYGKQFKTIEMISSKGERRTIFLVAEVVF